MTPTPVTTPLEAFNRYAKHDRLCNSIGYDYQCSCGLAETRDALSAVTETPLLLRERYWCGCVREARWTLCGRHTNLDHDDEPQTRAIEERTAGETREECPSEKFERVAEAFLDATGMLAPGKDDASGSHSCEARIEAWRIFIAGRNTALPPSHAGETP